MQKRRKTAFFIWFLALWAAASWALFEVTFPRSSYQPRTILLFIALGVSALFLLSVGLGLYRYLSKNEIRKKGTFTFLVATVVLVSFLTWGALSSWENKSRVQWYIDDLKSQGFTVEYFAQYPYNHGPVDHMYSYENFTSYANEYNCTWVGVYGGAPNYFLFFFPSNTWFLINQHGQWLFTVSWWKRSNGKDNVTDCTRKRRLKTTFFPYNILYGIFCVLRKVFSCWIKF